MVFVPPVFDEEDWAAGERAAECLLFDLEENLLVGPRLRAAGSRNVPGQRKWPGDATPDSPGSRVCCGGCASGTGAPCRAGTTLGTGRGARNAAAHGASILRS